MDLKRKGEISWLGMKHWSPTTRLENLRKIKCVDRQARFLKAFGDQFSYFWQFLLSSTVQFMLQYVEKNDRVNWKRPSSTFKWYFMCKVVKNVQVFIWNHRVWPFNWKRLSTTFMWYFKLIFRCKVVKTIRYIKS